ncbi:EAL domain-containing protein [Marinobacter subterrani]|uniref:PAS domain S-box/diguanylate cyclase (GGDEF) domain n=1 Tax=Marinobacter subterrani TaxID=1658765 RepID=A0A0J7J5Y3_9GAMM|nr:EAL domain-containing protein [Marinobacter subterrani]KMQ73364.1 PAS domain S-box/diguanylate cyclase (GGDEF) domain [Marinobacter subterrani]
MKEFIIRRYRSEHVPTSDRQTVVRIDDEGKVLFADHQAEAILGYDASELEGQPVHRILASRQDDPFAPANRHRIERGQNVLVTFRHKEGFFYTGSLSLRLDMRDSDKAASATITLCDSTSRDSRLLRSAESNAGFGIWELDTRSNEMTWTEGMFQILELKPGSDITPEQALFYCQTGQARVRAMFRRCMRTGESFALQLDILTSRQTPRRVILNCRALKQSGRVQRLGGTLVDRTGEMRLDRARQNAEQMLTATTRATPDLVVAVDSSFHLLHFNAAWASQFAQTFGVNPGPGDSLSELLREFPNERRLMERLWRRAFERDSFVVEMAMAQQARELPVHEFHYQRLTNEQGEVTGAVHVARRIEPRLNHASNGDYRIRHDPVTGLMNRKEFIARLHRTLEQKSHRESCDSLLYLDLDGFERFNDVAGSGTGDRYLRALAGNLGVRVRQRDALARLAGDTFALLIENCPDSRARKIAQETLDLIGEFVFEWQGQTLQTTASGGLLVMDSEIPGDPEQLLSQAADLCHTAKTSGRNRIHAARALAGHTDDSTASKRVAQIREALDNHHLVLEYQAMRPVASPTWGDHIEILCRIPATPDADTVLKPDDFLPIAERFDLAKRLDRQVIRQTLDWLGRQPLLEPRLKYCGFNLSLASVLDDTFADFMAQALRESPFDPDCFCLEIREAHATQYPDDVAVLCDALHRAGCRVALDGAGASVESYSLAAKLPVDIIKLDRRLVQHLEDDPVQQVMLEALHRIAEAAGKVTVATFIESDDALRKVRTLGIHYGQGYRLFRPQPLEQLTPAAVDLTTGRIGG